MYGKDEATDILGNHDTTILLRADKKILIQLNG